MAEERTYPQTDYMTCKKCGGTAFEFRWVTESYDDAICKSLCHDGWGYEVKISIVKCLGCGEESPYEEENFLAIKPKGWQPREG